MIETPFFAFVRALHLLLVPILLACASARAAAPATYTFTRVELHEHDPDFTFPLSVTGINDQGHVTSNWWFDFDGCNNLNTGVFDSRILLMIGGVWVDNGQSTSANAINASGQVAGLSQLSTTPSEDYGCGILTEAYGFYHAARSGPNGGAFSDLGTLGGDYSEGMGINTQGQVVGWSWLTNSTVAHGFVSGANNNVLIDIGTLGGSQSIATSINDSGQVVGYSQIPGNSAQHAFFRSAEGTLRDLGTLGGTNSYATAINSSGVVVGRSQIPGDGAYHVFVSAPNGGKLRDIGVSYDYGDGYGSGDITGPRINDRGEIVWTGAAGPLLYIPLLYTPGHGVDKIEDLLDVSVLPPGVGFWGLSSANAINGLGQITGVFQSDYNDAIYVISPAPRVETEKAVVSALSGATHTVSNDAKASAGAYTTLGATASGQYVTYSVPVTAPGTYRIQIGLKTGPARGTFQLAVNGVNQGKVQDEYATAITYPKRDLGTISFLAGGNKSFKFLVTGRNASSAGGSSLAFDYIELVPTARFETEELPVKGITPVPPGYTSFQWYGVFADSGASRGAGTYFNATAPGQFVTYTVKVAKAGYYNVQVGVQTKPNKGIFQLAINGADVGQPQDEYSSNAAFGVRGGYYYDYLYLGSGNQGFKFTVTGKNAASSGYTLAFDYIEIEPIQ